MHSYTGIGSRETPATIMAEFINLAIMLGQLNYTLRSGGADGADSSFELGCDSIKGDKEIYLPWRGFNSNQSELYTVGEDAIEIASKYHPNWHNLKPSIRKLMGRNVYQVLGNTLDSPSNFIVCYTKGGKLVGGTALAMRVAIDYNIPIFNYGEYNKTNEIIEFIKRR